MTEIKDTERELQLFRLRLSVAGVVVFVCFGLLMLRFGVGFGGQRDENRAESIKQKNQFEYQFDKNNLKNYSTEMAGTVGIAVILLEGIGNISRNLRNRLIFPN